MVVALKGVAIPLLVGRTFWWANVPIVPLNPLMPREIAAKAIRVLFLFGKRSFVAERCQAELAHGTRSRGERLKFLGNRMLPGRAAEESVWQASHRRTSQLPLAMRKHLRAYPAVVRFRRMAFAGIAARCNSLAP